eukprot:1477935-Prymnesium_polylepis.2
MTVRTEVTDVGRSEPPEPMPNEHGEVEGSSRRSSERFLSAMHSRSTASFDSGGAKGELPIVGDQQVIAQLRHLRDLAEQRCVRRSVEVDKQQLIIGAGAAVERRVLEQVAEAPAIRGIVLVRELVGANVRRKLRMARDHRMDRPDISRIHREGRR